MPLWRYEDDIFAPDAKIRIVYDGPNPFRVFAPTMTMVRNIMEVGSEDVWERDFRWDITSDPRSFFIRIYVNRGMDFRSKILTEIVFQGTQPTDPTKSGHLSLIINARLVTEYDLNGGWRKLPIFWGFLWMYHKIFYNKVRRGYLQMGEEMLKTLAAAYRRLLGLPAVPFPQTRI